VWPSGGAVAGSLGTAVDLCVEVVRFGAGGVALRAGFGQACVRRIVCRLWVVSGGRVLGWWGRIHPCRFPSTGNLGHTRCPRDGSEVRRSRRLRFCESGTCKGAFPPTAFAYDVLTRQWNRPPDGEANRLERQRGARGLPRGPARAGMLWAHWRAARGRRGPRPDRSPGRGSDDRRDRAIRPGASAFREYSLWRGRIFDGWSCRLQGEAAGAHDLVS